MDSSDVALENKSSLILGFIQELHSVNISSDAIESRMAIIAKRFGIGLKIITLQSSATIEITSGSRSVVHISRFPFSTHWNLRKLNDLLGLCDAVEAGKTDAVSAERDLKRIHSYGQLYPKFLVVFCYAIYSMAVAARVGGGVFEIGVAALVGIVAGAIHFGTVVSRRIDLQKSFLGALCGSLAACILSLILPPFDYSRAIFAGIVLLVPALVVTIGTHEVVNEAVESGLDRLGYGLVRFLMIAFGTSAVAVVWSTFATLPVGVEAADLSFFAKFCVMIVGSLALVVCMQGRRSDIPWIVSGALIAFSCQELTHKILRPNGGPFLSTFVLGLAGILLLGSRGRPPQLMIFPGLLQLAPGFIGSEAVLAFLRGTVVPGGDASFFHVLLAALQISAGLFVASAFQPKRARASVPDDSPGLG